MGVISLITDFGTADNFVGVMKAAILKINPAAVIVDITHEVRRYDILEAAFLLKGSFRYFPKGTIHLVVVDPGVGTAREKLLVQTKDYFFIGPDNGVLSLALEDEPAQDIVDITNENYFLKPVSDTFHGRDIFAPTAAYLSKGERCYKFGRPIKRYRRLEIPPVKKSTHRLCGEIIYIDRFGNLISNIDRQVFYNFAGKKKFKIRIKDKNITGLSHSYCTDRDKNKPIALVDSFDYLEIAVFGSSASDYLKAGRGTALEIIRDI